MAAERARDVEDEEQPEPAARPALGRVVRLGEARQHRRRETRATVADRDHQGRTLARRFQAQPAGRGLERVVEHVVDHLFQRRIRHHGQVGAEAVLELEGRRLAAGAPGLGDLAEKAGDRRLLGRLAARFAGREQDAADDRLAARDLGLHLGEFLGQFAIGADRRHALPVAEDDRQGAERRAELVGGARGEEAGPHDVVLLGGPLAQRREPRVARLQAALHPHDRGDEQRGVQQKADQEALHVGRRQAAAGWRRQGERAIRHREAGEAGGRHRQQAPRRPGFEQHRAERDLQQEEEAERVGDAAAEIKQRRQRADVDHQRDEERVIAQRPLRMQTPVPLARGVERGKAGEHAEHRVQRQANAVGEVHQQDRRQLGTDGEPAQLHQLPHGFVPARRADARSAVGAGHARCREACRAGLRVNHRWPRIGRAPVAAPRTPPGRPTRTR